MIYSERMSLPAWKRIILFLISAIFMLLQLGIFGLTIYFSIDSATYFSSPVAMYSFNFSSNETSNFVPLEGNPIIKRIVSTPSLVSAL